MKTYLVNKIDGVLADETGEVILSSTVYITVSTYNDMLLLETESRLRIVRVISDENKGISNAIYYIYPDDVRIWVAATADN